MDKIIELFSLRADAFGMKKILSKSYLVVVLLSVLFSLSVLAETAGSPAYQELMRKVDQLVNEQKLQAALDLINSEALTINDSLDQARIITKTVQFESGLHDYETAVNNFRSKKWPEDVKAQTLLNIFNAYTLQQYAQAYSWEIRQRNKIESKEKKGLKFWTVEEIYFEAVKGMALVWSTREKLNSFPKNELQDFVSPNTYPQGIRDSFRDSFAHLFVRILNDSSGWSPEQSNEIYRLDLKNLMLGKTSANLSLESAKPHPLEKIALVLHDLKEWHTGQRNFGAALDAELELLKILHQRFSSSSDKSTVRQHLENLLPNYVETPWYSMGMGTLAQFWQQSDIPEALITARKIADQGVQKYPASMGAKLCRDIVKEIDRPSFELQAMKVDGSGRRSIGLDYKNLTKIHFFSFKYDIKKFLKQNQDYHRMPDWRQVQGLIKAKPANTWSVDLLRTTDFRTHKFFVTPPKHDPGFYIVVASMLSTLDESSNIIHGSMMTFGDLVLSSKIGNSQADLEVHNGNDGSAVKNASLEIYRIEYKKPSRLEATLKTDENGRATFRWKRDAENYGQFVAFAAQKEHFTFQEFQLYHSQEDVTHSPRAMIYTDRSIYRPQQKIMWKAIFFRPLAETGRFRVLSQAKQTVTLVDINGQEISKHEVKTDDFGAAWGEFTIPSGRALGQWYIRTLSGSHAVRVEEYKRPTFELSWKPQSAPLRLNRKAQVIGEAKYYFGAPLTVGKVRYTVQRQILFPWWCFFGFWNFASYQNPQNIESAETAIQADGSFEVTFLPEADSRFSNGADDLKYSYSIDVEVTDEGGETRTAQKSITLGVKAVEASLSVKEQFLLEGAEAQARLRRTFLTGDPAPGKGSWKLVKLKEPKDTLMPASQSLPSYLSKLKPTGLYLPDDNKPARWTATYNWQGTVRDWSVESVLKNSAVTADESGETEIKIPELKVGAYRLIYETTDPFGVAVETQTEFFVANQKYRPSLPGLFLANRSEAKVGEVVHLWLPTGLKNQTMIFEVFQDGKIKQTKHLNSSKDSLLLKWPITEDMRGGIGFTLRFLNDYQSLNFAQNIFVPWDNKEIGIEFSSFREKLRPGQSETWSVKLTGPKKEKLKKASTQLLAYMYDRSLDLLAPHYSPSLLSIYPTRHSSNFPNVGLGVAPGIYFQTSYDQVDEFSPPQDDLPKFYANYGIGGPGKRGGGMAMSVAEGMDDSAPAASALREQSVASPLEKKAVLKKKEQQAEGEAPQIRSNFSETAFFYPNLTTNNSGTVEIKFQVPDSVTSWTLWLQGLTKDLLAVSSTKQVQTVKELLIRPYLPRFLREGDAAELRFVLNNTSDKTIAGKINIDLLDGNNKTDASTRFQASTELLKNVSFSIPPKKSFTHQLTIKTPAGLGSLVIKAVAQAGNQSDGELRSLPVLPGRYHLAQSKFVTLKDTSTRKLEFAELLSNKDSTRINERMVVQIDAQLFYSVLSALPYLVNYPYECIEQTLNRFISTGILTSLFTKYPSIEKMAKNFSSRQTQFESFNTQDPNRRMALEETPWLNEAKGGKESTDSLVNILDSRIATQNRQESLSKLEKAQTSLGGFPWFSGGPPSPYMTLYVVYGFSKAIEFGVAVPKPMIQKAWEYLHQYYITEVIRECLAHNSCWELVTFLNYVLSNYPDTSWGNNIFTDAERKTMLEFSFKHWKEHSPYLKGYLALTLLRSQRSQDAKLVWDSVMDSAKYNADEGTHWAREDRSWLWYNDTIETHAFALRTLMELGADNGKRDGLVQWLFLNKKLNHWHSTRATSEVIYSLAHYLTKTNQMGQKEAVTLKIGKEKPIEMNFSPEKYTGKKNQIVYEGSKVSSSLMPITVQKSTPGFMFASANWQFSTEELPTEEVGDFLNVSRKYFLVTRAKKEVVLKPLAEGAQVQVGDEVEVHISLRSKSPVGYVHLRDPRGAGFEPVDATSKHKWDLGLYWYEEIRDSGINFFFEQLPQGEYNFRYRVRAATAGVFKVSPATVQPMYAPEFAAYSSGLKLIIKQ